MLLLMVSIRYLFSVSLETGGDWFIGISRRSHWNESLYRAHSTSTRTVRCPLPSSMPLNPKDASLGFSLTNRQSIGIVGTAAVAAAADAVAAATSADIPIAVLAAAVAAAAVAATSADIPIAVLAAAVAAAAVAAAAAVQFQEKANRMRCASAELRRLEGPKDEALLSLKTNRDAATAKLILAAIHRRVRSHAPAPAAAAAAAWDRVSLDLLLLLLLLQKRRREALETEKKLKETQTTQKENEAKVEALRSALRRVQQPTNPKP